MIMGPTYNRLALILTRMKKQPRNVRLGTLIHVARALGFRETEASKRSGGSHIVMARPGLREILTLQPDKKKRNLAKAYQVRQFLDIVDEHALLDTLHN